MRKDIRHIPVDRYSTKYLTSDPQNGQGNQKQSLRKCHNQGQPKKARILNTIYPDGSPEQMKSIR